LLMKEKLVRMGKSIYKGDSSTLNLHEAFNSISKDVALPEKPRIESLHDIRNNIQHAGLSIDAFTADFYITEAYNFFRRFLREEPDIDLSVYLPANLRLHERAILFDNSAANANSVVSVFPEINDISVPVRNIGEVVKIPRALVRDIDNLVALKILDDWDKDASLVGKNDILIIRETSQIRNGDAVAVRISNETLLRYFYDKGETVELRPSNSASPSRIVIKSQLEIIGKIVLVIREVDTTETAG
jgi:SOS-response transcriptional repressor LexA